MKKIELIELTELLPVNIKKEVPISTIELIKMAVNNTPPGGFAITDMVNRMRILDKIDSANGAIELEDSDYENLKKYVNETKWNVLSKTIIDFVNSFK